MLLLIAHHYDAEARWLYDLLQSEKQVESLLLIPEALGVDYSISLHLNNCGKPRAAVYFYDTGITLNGDCVCYVINRLSYINPLTWQQASTIEKTYAASEINSFFSAFIYSFTCPVSNPIHNGSLYGEAAATEKWAHYCKQNDLTVHPLLSDCTGRIYNLLQNIAPENIYRYMQIGSQLMAPPQQEPAAIIHTLKKMVSANGENEMQEFTFLQEEGVLHLLQVSKLPLLSLYAHQVSGIIYQQFKNKKHDLIDGHTQRNTCTVAG